MPKDLSARHLDDGDPKLLSKTSTIRLRNFYQHPSKYPRDDEKARRRTGSVLLPKERAVPILVDPAISLRADYLLRMYMILIQ